MVIGINEYSDIPIYIQIRDQIVMGISEGVLLPGEQLPTVRALAMDMGVNTMTVSKAYQQLKQEGYIVTDRRSGARISANFKTKGGIGENNFLQLKRIASEAKVDGMSEEQFLAECRKAYGGK